MFTIGWNFEFSFRVIVWSVCLKVVVSQIRMPTLMEVQAGQTFSFPIESDSDDPDSRIVCKFSSDGINFKHLYNSEFDGVRNDGSNLSDRLKAEKKSTNKVRMAFTYVTTADQGWYFCAESNNENAFTSMHLIVRNCSNYSCQQPVSNTTSLNDTEDIQPVKTLSSNSTETDGNGLSNVNRIVIGLASAIIITGIVGAVVVCMVKRFKKKGCEETDVERPILKKKDSASSEVPSTTPACNSDDTEPPPAAGNPD